MNRSKANHILRKCPIDGVVEVDGVLYTQVSYSKYTSHMRGSPCRECAIYKAYCMHPIPCKPSCLFKRVDSIIGEE